MFLADCWGEAGARKSGDLTCGHYMEEMDKHVLKIGIGI